jgi:anti-anti-sigma factor
MNITTHGTTLSLSGRFDGRSTGRVRDALYSQIHSTHGDVVVDVSDVESVDSTALKVLGAASHRLERQGRHLVLRGCCPSVRRTLAFSRMRRLFRLDPDPVQQAVTVGV